MVALAERTQAKLTLQTLEIAQDTTTIRSLDWDRDRFDIEFELQNGTTYNSFLIRGEKTALVDTSHEKFRSLYLDRLLRLINPAELDYLVISHTEPDHSGLVREVLQLAPQVTVVGSKVAIQFLDDLVHQPFKRLLVKNGDRLDLGNGHELEFVSAPNLHWPDTILTYDHKTQILYTCDVFGMHYCDDNLYDEELELLEADYKLYYDCLMGPNARSVLAALKRMKDLPEIDMIATGHGPLLRYNIPDLVGRYRDWSQAQAKAETTVALFYILAIAAAIVLTVLLDAGWRWFRYKQRIQSRLTNQDRGLMALVTCLTAVVIVVPALPFLFLRFQGWVIGEAPSLYQYLAAQPQSTLVASLDLEASNLPAFTQRSTLVGREFALPHHPVYYHQFQQRLIDLIRAQYSLDSSVLSQFIEQYDINFFLIGRSAFTPAYLNQDWLIHSSFQDLVRQVAQQLEQGSQPVLLQTIPKCQVAASEKLILLDAVCVQQF
ncbi:FprA family A-type flavoprotein [Leptolyngbya sp. 7M]|uniref:FprA family A-type flavoprotein n=1 Tax=Leptolyngbya sp. 7M TaxID=2812896 RepID=UPI001B8C509E|nr:FprA family A-type flavoprotein [Leptolyngbya sp. 7M]QYO64996.1 FprA family A-type flavoprotein [Leptolyngbya sp. 7M]